MIALAPVAFIGYGFDVKSGFYQAICPLCDDFQRAVRESKGLNVRRKLCSKHAYELTCKRLGEQP